MPVSVDSSFDESAIVTAIESAVHLSPLLPWGRRSLYQRVEPDGTLVRCRLVG